MQNFGSSYRVSFWMVFCGRFEVGGKRRKKERKKRKKEEELNTSITSRSIGEVFITNAAFRNGAIEGCGGLSTIFLFCFVLFCFV